MSIFQTLLAQIIERLFPGKHIIRHDHPDWLEGLELDIHIPELGLAFEYQGQQHFHPIKAWGGKKALKAVKARDCRKVDLCKKRGLRLIVLDYTEPLTELHIKRRLIEAEISPQGS